MHIDNHLNVNGLNALAKRHKLNRYKNKTCIHAVWGFPGSSASKESACNAKVCSSIPELGRSPREGIGYPLQCSWASLVAQI